MYDFSTKSFFLSLNVFIETLLAKVKAVVYELLDIENRGKLVSVPVSQPLDKQESDACFETNISQKPIPFHIYELLCSDHDGIVQFCSC